MSKRNTRQDRKADGQTEVVVWLDEDDFAALLETAAARGLNYADTLRVLIRAGRERGER